MMAAVSDNPSRHQSCPCNESMTPYETGNTNYFCFKPTCSVVTTAGRINDSPTTTAGNSSGPICRICHEGDVKDELVAPCRCSGSMALVHRICLEKWLSSSNSETCEICKFKFVIYREPKPFTEWIMRPASPEECRNLVGDILCFALLTPLASVSSYLCFSGAKHYASWSTKWEASGLICLSVMLISIYMTWCFVTVRYHLRHWRSWQTNNQNVYLVRVRKVSSEPRLGPNNPMTVNHNRSNNSGHLFQLGRGSDTDSHILTISGTFGNTSSIASAGFRPNTPSVFTGDVTTPQSAGPIRAAMIEMVSFETGASTSGYIRSSSFIEYP